MAALTSLGLRLRTLQLHLAELEGDAGTDAASHPIAPGSTIRCIIRIIDISTHSVPVEDVVHIQMDGDTALPELGAQSGINAVARTRDCEHTHALGAVIGRGVHLQHLPQFGPEVQPEAVT